MVTMFRSDADFSSLAMPVLEHLEHIFQTEFGQDFSKLPNRENTLFVIVQHGFPTIRPMMEAFLRLGVGPDKVFMTTKPHTTPREMQDYFQESFSTQYLPFQWSSPEAQNASQSHYKQLTAATHHQLFQKFCEYLFRYPKPAHIKNIVICDEGGKFLNEFIERYHRPDNRYSKKLSDYHVVAIEHTKCGTYGEALARLPFPLINMADSYLKTHIESEFIAKSMFVDLNAILIRITSSFSAKIGVVGGGNIGKEVLAFLLRTYPESSIIIYDREPSVLSSAKIIEQDWRNVARVESIQAVFQQANIILGCTGHDVTDTLSLESLTLNPANKIHCISCSSGDAEFHSLLHRMPDYKFESLADIRDFTMSVNGNKQLTIYNGGFPINFLVHQPESVPVDEIQITRSMKLAALVQALKLLEVLPYMSNEQSLEGYIQLDVSYQWHIIQAFYRDLMRSDFPEKRIQAEDKYSRIAKKEIAQGSVGVPQPTMSSVLRIPHYIKTNYQIKMDAQLSHQSAPIKLLVINGTAGSGKTTLAQHYLEKQRLQAPQNLNCVLLAETKEQWLASLRGLAEELYPELNVALKAEQDSKKQERLVIQALQKALRKQKWCIIVDNWDQNKLLIGEIEHLFLNQGSNVGAGVLLITTQGQSPYGAINSLDLSHGFAPDESRELLIKVMNLEEEMGLNWEDLGSEADLQALTTLLNHLPLATVLAGSYLMWENKSRQGGASGLFTYTDYKQMLELHVEELIRVHDEHLGNRGRIPREEREEFIRIKTQEAAVDLSLKKAIQTASNNPNMNLWQLLCFCGFLGSDGIPQQLLKDYIIKITEDKISDFGFADAIFDSLITEANKYSLLQFEREVSAVDQKNSLHIHRVVQKVLRDNYWNQLLDKLHGFIHSPQLYTRESVILRKSMRDALGVMRLNEAIEYKVFPIVRAYYSHIEVWLTYTKETSVMKNSEFEDSVLLMLLGHCYGLLGKYREQEEVYKKTNTITQQHSRGQQNAASVSTQQNLAASYIASGDFLKAKPILESALIMYDAEDVGKAVIQENLAIVHEKIGQHEEAEMLYRKILPIKILHHGEIHLEISRTKNNLASTLTTRGKYSEAWKLYQEAIDIETIIHKTSEHVNVAETEANFACLLKIMGKHKDAENAFRSSLRKIIAHYGDSHLKVSEVQQNLAGLLHILGQMPEAESLLRSALKIRIDYHRTKKHIEVAIVQQNLAVLLKNRGEYVEAESLYLEVLQTKIDHFKGESNISVATTQNNLAILFNKMKRYSESEALHRKALAVEYAHYHGTKHMKVAETQQNLAATLQLCDKHQEAGQLLSEALATMIDHYRTKENIAVAKVKNNLAMLELQLKNYDSAYRLACECEYTFQTQPGGQLYLQACRTLKELILANKTIMSSLPTGTAYRQESDSHLAFQQDSNVGKNIRQAAGNGKLDDLMRLLFAHADQINAIDTNSSRGWTALHWAIYNNKSECVTELLQRGARYDIADKSEDAKTAVDICIAKNDAAICQLLNKYMIRKYVSANDHDAEKALRGAAAHNDLVAAKFFLAQGVNINAAGPGTGKTALHQAVDKKNRVMIKFLIQAGADTNIEDFSRKKAIACTNNDTSLQNFILDEILNTSVEGLSLHK